MNKDKNQASLCLQILWFQIVYTSFVKMSSVQGNCTGHGILFMVILVDYRMCAM
jgi:hypothetical protein